MRANVLIISIILLINVHSLQAIPEEIEPPRYNINKIPVRDLIINEDELISVRFPQINFEISGALYLQEGQVQEKHIYNLSQYTGVDP